MSAAEKLELIIKETNNSYYSLHKEIGLKHTQNLYDIKNGKVRSISFELAHKINSKYPQYSIDWLQGDVEENIVQNAQPNKEASIGRIPMYNFPVAAGGVETYIDPNDVKIVGHLNIPGAHKDSIAIPAYGDSMYPTLTNGDWAVSRPISDPTEIVWGELYYIEWSDYKMYKRLLHADNEDEVILWSDNQLDKIGDRPKFAPIVIKKEKIRKLRLVTEILKKPNY